MIAFALEFLLKYIERDLNNVSIANVAMVPEDNSVIKDGIFITLVNIEEEVTKKNYPTLRKENAAGNVEYKNAPVFLNLYLLFSSKVEKQTNYIESLKNISKIIACFQAKNIFTISNTAPDIDNFNTKLNDKQAQNFRLQLELYSMTFEQLNHLWGTLGGKQYPSVMYKVRLVEIEKDLKQGRGKLIEEVTIKTTTS